MRIVLWSVLIFGIAGLGGYVLLEQRRLAREETRFGLIGDPVVGYRALPDINEDGFSTNALSMRAPSVPDEADDCTLRVLMLGDSVVFGNEIRDADLATSRLERALAERLGWPVWVGNAATGGWAPNNIRGYIQRFGWLKADMIGFVLNSHDIEQSNVIDPTLADGAPLDMPPMRFVDRVRRWLVRTDPFGLIDPAIEPDPYTPDEGAPPAEEVLAGLFEEASRLGPTFVFHNRVVGEIEEHDEVGEKAKRERRRAPRLASLVRDHDVAYTDLGETMAATPGAYSDQIHLTAAGQAVLAEAMIEAMTNPAESIIKTKPADCPTKNK
jgi:hypothetical protein